MARPSGVLVAGSGALALLLSGCGSAGPSPSSTTSSRERVCEKPIPQTICNSSASELQSYPASDVDDCCSRCQDHGDCAAFTFISADDGEMSYCHLKSSCDEMVSYERATSGTVVAMPGTSHAPTSAPATDPTTVRTTSPAPATTHYGTPLCMDDEQELEVGLGVVCAASCDHVSDCSLDLPADTMATRQCKDSRCSLRCGRDAGCPAGAVCVKDGGVFTGTCVFQGVTAQFRAGAASLV